MIKVKKIKISLFLLLAINSVHFIASDSNSDDENDEIHSLLFERKETEGDVFYCKQPSGLQSRTCEQKQVTPEKIVLSAIKITRDELQNISMLQDRQDRVQAKYHTTFKLLDSLIKVCPNKAEAQIVVNRKQWEEDRIAMRGCCCCNSVNYKEKCANEGVERTIKFAQAFSLKLQAIEIKK